MQEKVQSAPPPVIKMVEGKAPPTSWVEENIVQYLQDRTQASFLKDVLAYAQGLQAQQLSQTRPKVVSLKEAFSPVSEEGSAEDISHASTFNTTQGLVKTQIETFEKLILLTQQGNPQLTSQTKGMLEELRQIAQSFPQLSPGQVQNLNTILQQLNKNVANLPNSYQRAFWNTQVLMLQSMMNDNKGNSQDYQGEIKELQAKIKMLGEMIQELKEMQKALTATPPSAKQFQNLIETLQTLANRFGELNPAGQQAMGALFHQLNQFTTQSGKPLAQLIADTLIHTKLTAFLKSNPKATPQQIVEHLKAFLKQSNLQSSTLPFLQSLGDSIEDVLSKKGFPESESSTGTPFAISSQGIIQPNEDVPRTTLASYVPTGSSLSSLEKAVGALTSSAQKELPPLEEKVKGFTDTFKNLSDAQEHLGKSAAWAVGQSYAAGEHPALGAQAGGMEVGAADGSPSLPNQFANAILNHYMPGQQAYLEQLAMMLFLDNMGAQFGNQLLSTMSDFSGAGVNYNFSNSLHKQGNDFSGSVTQAQNQLNNEKTQVNNDLNNANNAYNQAGNDIAKIQDKINGPPKPSASQLKVLEAQKASLEQLQGNLKVAIGQLKQLQSALNNITIGNPVDPPKDPTKSFHVYGANGGDPPAGWQSAINNGERLVINGDPTIKPPAPQGGLVRIAADVTTFQQTYSDQSQNQQMILQMRMTEIQQEWTVVSTALQLLNQMYMTAAQGIYK